MNKIQINQINITGVIDIDLHGNTYENNVIMVLEDSRQIDQVLEDYDDVDEGIVITTDDIDDVINMIENNILDNAEINNIYVEVDYEILDNDFNMEWDEEEEDKEDED